MKYAIRYYSQSKAMTKANEIIIKYNKKSPYLIKFAEDVLLEGQRLVVDITMLEDIKSNLNIFNAAAQVRDLALMTTKADSNLEFYAENQIDYFFIEGAGTLDEVAAQIDLGVSDIYIINELGFSLNQIGDLCHDNGIKVRVFPNVAQSSSKYHLDTFKEFYIRPEDIEIYQDYIDVIEFFGPLDKQNVLYNIYSEGRWLGNLNEIILGLNDNITNNTVMYHFGPSRLKCNKRCIFGKCSVCDAIKVLAETMEEKEVGLKYECRINAEALQNDSAETIESAEEIS